MMSRSPHPPSSEGMMAAAPPPSGAAASAPRFERHGGYRLQRAFAEVDELPALRDARTELVGMLADSEPRLEEVVLTIESDPALAIAVLRRAPAGERAGIPAAVRALGWSRLRAVVEGLPTFDFFDRSRLLAREAARLRVHGLAVQRTTQQILDALERGVDNRLVVAALVHDIGKVVLGSAYDRYPSMRDLHEPPDQRVKLERTAFGIDHAAAGALFLRRLELADELVVAVERHHSGDARGDGAILQTADALAHYAAGRPVDPGQLAGAAERAGLTATMLRRLLQHPDQAGRGRRAQLAPCPLTARQIEAIRGLHAGKSYKEIADELGTSVSTIRSHLHRVYSRLGVGDRAQAVLVALRHGWI
jgi:putative nucleotidyltransferase with HDIG domain